jgi:hypothetical protein
MRRLFGSAATKEMSDWLAVVQFYHPSHAADIPWISDFCYQFRTPVLLAKTRVVASQVPDKIQTPVPDFVKSLSVYETESRHVLSFIRLPSALTLGSPSPSSSGAYPFFDPLFAPEPKE